MTTSCTPMVEETLQGHYIIKRYHYSNRIADCRLVSYSTLVLKQDLVMPIIDCQDATLKIMNC